MSENIIVAIIGVISSVFVFVMTLIANKISHVKTVRYEQRRKIIDKLCADIHTNNRNIKKLKKCISKCYENFCTYIEDGGYLNIKQSELEQEYSDFKKAYYNVMDLTEEILFFIENNIIPLNKYKVYYFEISQQYRGIKDLDQYYYETYIDAPHEAESGSLGKNEIDELIEQNEGAWHSINKIYFYSYNLLVNLQNDTYSKYFNNKKMLELLDYRYENLKIEKDKNKEIDLFFGGTIIDYDY